MICGDGHNSKCGLPCPAIRRGANVKSSCRVSGFVFLAAFLCFLPCAFGQSTANPGATASGHGVLNAQPTNFLAFALTKGDDFFKNNNKNNNNNNNNNGKGGCSGSYSSYDKKSTNCAAMPEGGTPLIYLLVAGFSCLGGVVLRSRQQGSMAQAD